MACYVFLYTGNCIVSLILCNSKLLILYLSKSLRTEPSIVYEVAYLGATRLR